MKRLLFVLILTVTITTSCTKDEVVFHNTNITGKWALTEYYVNPGPATNEWQTPTDDLKHTLEFKNNGDFISTGYLYYDSDSFAVTDAIYIKFLNASQANGELLYTYRLLNDNAILLIMPQCFEGCAYKYKAVQ